MDTTDNSPKGHRASADAGQQRHGQGKKAGRENDVGGERKKKQEKQIACKGRDGRGQM